MTVPSIVTRTTYSGDGASVAFSVPFYFLTNADLVVLLVDSDGNSTTQVLTTNYTVTGAGVEAGGTVTMLVAPPSGYELVIYRDPVVTQLVDYAPNDPFPAETHERALDRLTMIAQRLKELVTRSFRLPDSDTSGASTVLQPPEPLKVIGWSNDGLSLVNTDASTLATVVTAGNPIYEYFDGDGATLAFTVSSDTLGSLPATRVFISGVRQSPGTDYTISAATVTFSVAPPSGTDNILVEWTDAIAAVGVPSDGSVTLPKIMDGVFAVSSAALLKFADGFFAATAEARAKFADGFVTLAKLATNIFNGATTVTLAAGDKIVIADVSDSGNTKVALASDISSLVTVPVSKLFDIDASVAGNALTITVNPGAGDFRSTTLTDGTPVARTLSSAASVVVPNTALLGTVNAQSARLAVLLIDNAGTLEAAVINTAGGNQLDETNLISTTAISAAADAANVAYSTVARSNVAYRVVGFIDITEASAGVWATAPTLVQPCGGQALAALSSLGYGQTWQNVTGSRSIGTTYYNTTGKPIYISVVATNTATTNSITLTINSVVVTLLANAWSNTYGQVFGIVPPGGSYAVTISGTVNLNTWAELR